MDRLLSPTETEILMLSLRVSLLAVAVSLPFGIAFAYLLSRRSFWGKSLLDGLIHLPLILPTVVTGYILLLLLGRNGPLGRLLGDIGIVLAFRWTGAAVAAAVMGLPLLVRPIRLSLDAIPAKLELAASTLGARPLWVFATVTLPLMIPGILTGAVLSFGKSLGEFGATIMFVSNIPGETETLPLAIYASVQEPGGEAEALRLAIISIALSMSALVASEYLARRAKRRLTGIP
jgi:molybdate transport system permease protein